MSKLCSPTYKVYNPGTVYRRESEWASDSILEYSSNITSIQEAEQEQSELDQFMDWISSPLAKRDSPTIGVCGRNAGSGILPDSIGKIFHPTNLGHELIASYVTWTIGNAIAKREGVTSPACQIDDEITCHSSKGSKGRPHGRVLQGCRARHEWQGHRNAFQQTVQQKHT